MIERAYTEGERKLGLAVWTEDEAGPYQTVPYPGASWQPTGEPKRRPHEYVRRGTAKLLTLFHPASGEVRVRGVRRATNEVLHPWLKEEFTSILETLPPPKETLDPEHNRAEWKSWQEGLSVRITLPEDLPTLRMLLVWDNLIGHLNAGLLLWMFDRGIMVLYTPLGGSWLNMTESIQRILTRRALEGEHPRRPEQIIGWLEPEPDSVRVGRSESAAASAGSKQTRCPTRPGRQRSLYAEADTKAEEHRGEMATRESSDPLVGTHRTRNAVSEGHARSFVWSATVSRVPLSPGLGLAAVAAPDLRRPNVHSERRP